jgi:hypothetical protein
MDWTATPDMHTQFQQHGDVGDAASGDHVNFNHQHSSQGGGAGGGVGRLVAHFENKGFDPAPPLPPRPIPNAAPTPNVHANPSPSMHFGGFSQLVDHNRVSSPIGSPTDTNFGSWDAQSRMTSPLATSPPVMFPASFHDGSRVSSPIGGPSSGQFGSLDDFMSSNRINNHQMMSTPIVASPSQSAPAAPAPGTPGFEIWRPPVPMTPKPTQSQFGNSTNSGNFFKPPVPTTPKPVMNAGSQFILEFNPGAKGKGKAPAKPARPRVVPPVPSGFDAQIKQELPPTPKPSDIPVSSPASAQTPTASSSALARPSREQVPAEAWEQFKTTIRGLYLEDRKPLKEVMSIMADKYGFQAT